MRRFSIFIILLAALSCKKSDPQSDQKALLTFGFTKAANPSLSADASGLISGQQVTLMLPAGTNASGLKATFSASPLSNVTVNGARQESGVTANDFTRPVTYRVTAEDGSTADYTVSVTVAKSSEKNLTTFTFLKTANPELPADLPLTLSGTQLSATLPAGVKPTGLKASFTTPPAATVTVNGVRQESGVTANDFTNPQTYRVTAEDGTTADYTVALAVTRSNARELLSLQFLKTANASLTDDVAVALNPSQSSYLVTLPTGAVPSALKATFAASPGATVTVNGAAQTSGATVVDFSQPVVYRVTAETGEFREYTVETSVQGVLPAVDDAVRAFMTKWNVPGMSVAIALNERLVYAKGYGQAVKETNTPVTPATQFRVASVSKTITAIAALKLVDEGKLSLDQRVFGAGGILGTTYGNQPYGANLEKITVRQLLDNTAGGDAWTSGWDLAQNRIDPFYQKEWLGYTQAQVIGATLDTRPPTQTPGSKFVYSNVGLNIAGRVVEKASGMKYETYVQEAILKPLGIRPTAMRVGGTTQADRFPNEVVYYHPYPGYDQPYDFPVSRMDAHGGWVSTAVDLTRLLVHTDGLSGKRDILSSKSVGEMLKPSAVSLSQLGGNIGYGLGTYVNPFNTYSTHRGGMAGMAAVWWRLDGGSTRKHTWVLLMNTQPNNGAFLGELDALLNAYLTNPVGTMKGDQFEVFYK